MELTTQQHLGRGVATLGPRHPGRDLGRTRAWVRRDVEGSHGASIIAVGGGWLVWTCPSHHHPDGSNGSTEEGAVPPCAANTSRSIYDRRQILLKACPKNL